MADDLTTHATMSEVGEGHGDTSSSIAQNAATPAANEVPQEVFQPTTKSPLPRLSAQHIKALRMKYQWSQQAMADYLGITRKTVTLWEAGKFHPTPKVARELWRLWKR